LDANARSQPEEIAPAFVFLAARVTDLTRLPFSIEKFASSTPMRRPAQHEEIASCSSYITGEVLPIIGGYSGG